MADVIRIIPFNYIDTATSVTATSEATRFPVTNLQSNIKDRLWRSTSQSTQTITGTFPIVGGGAIFSAWGLWPGAQALYLNFVRFKIFDGTDLLFDSGLDRFTMPGSSAASWVTGEAFSNSTYAGSSGFRAPHVEYFTPVTTAESGPTFELTVQHNGTPTAGYFEARRLWAGAYVDAPFPADASSFTWRWVTTSQAKRAFGTSLRRLVGSKTKAFRFDTFLNSEADRAKWAAILYYCEPGAEVVVSLFQEGDKATQNDFTILGSVFNASMVAVSYGVWKVSFEVEES